MVENVNYLPTAMIQEEDLKKYYLNFINFLLQQKHVLLEVGLRFDMTSMQTLALLLLDKPISMSSLTSALSCDPSNVTGIIDGLQRKELVQRVENPEDRRMRLLVLSKAGQKLRSSLFKHLVDEVDPNPIFSKLTTQELLTFFSLIDKVTQ